MSRYDEREIYSLFDDQYSELLDKRNVKAITHYGSPSLRHPTVEERASVQMTPHIWSTGDRLYKLAFEHYGDETLWWIIAWWNGAPTEAHLIYGDVIYIPKPLNMVYDMLGY